MPTDVNTCKYYGTLDETGHIRCATCPYVVDRYLCSCSSIGDRIPRPLRSGRNAVST